MRMEPSTTATGESAPFAIYLKSPASPGDLAPPATCDPVTIRWDGATGRLANHPGRFNLTVTNIGVSQLPSPQETHPPPSRMQKRASESDTLLSSWPGPSATAPHSSLLPTPSFSRPPEYWPEITLSIAQDLPILSDRSYFLWPAIVIPSGNYILTGSGSTPDIQPQDSGIWYVAPGSKVCFLAVTSATASDSSPIIHGPTNSLTLPIPANPLQGGDPLPHNRGNIRTWLYVGVGAASFVLVTVIVWLCALRAQFRRRMRGMVTRPAGLRPYEVGGGFGALRTPGDGKAKLRALGLLDSDDANSLHRIGTGNSVDDPEKLAALRQAVRQAGFTVEAMVASLARVARPQPQVETTSHGGPPTYDGDE
ncbi:hypothetical protein AURDEDRAFT_172502 [Auricularia subglabra TFB-10046 SS5]|nr:hypothetical protein AURDEDRAFT_172502 [Auricularia subglabra TFB-10046 SS5]